MASRNDSGLKSEDDIPRQITGESRELLKRFINEPEPKQGKECNKVTKQLCDTMCEMKQSGMSGSEIADNIGIVSQNAVYYHTRGDCTHEKGNKITYSECGWMRVKSRKGALTETLAVLYNVTKRTAQVHLSGKCSHDQGIEPVPKDVRYQNYKDKL